MTSTKRSRDMSWPPAPEPLPVPVIDNHTHLDHIEGVLGDGIPRFTVAEELQRAAAVGVTKVVQVGCDSESAVLTHRWVSEYEAMVGAVAIHPNEAPLHARVADVGPDGLIPQPENRHELSLDEAIAQIAGLIRSEPRLRAVGETGLDYFRSGERGRVAQQQSFREHMAIARELDVALQIHDRDAHEDVIRILLSDGAPERTAFHCFSGDRAMAEVCADNGWYVSVAGPVTFRANDELRAAIDVMPIELLLVETDAPFLTPHPMRGRPNAPYVLPYTVRFLAEQRDVAIADLCAQLAANTHRVYGDW